jgi:hypothetical protein
MKSLFAKCLTLCLAIALSVFSIAQLSAGNNVSSSSLGYDWVADDCPAFTNGICAIIIAPKA